MSTTTSCTSTKDNPRSLPLITPILTLGFLSAALFLALFFLPPTLPLFSLGEPIPLGLPIQTPAGLKVRCKIPITLQSYNWYGIELGRVYVRYPFTSTLHIPLLIHGRSFMTKKIKVKAWNYASYSQAQPAVGQGVSEPFEMKGNSITTVFLYGDIAISNYSTINSAKETLTACVIQGKKFAHQNAQLENTYQHTNE
jgi:hypothetical protein